MKDYDARFTIGPDEAPLVVVEVNEANRKYWFITVIVLLCALAFMATINL